MTLIFCSSANSSSVTDRFLRCLLNNDIPLVLASCRGRIVEVGDADFKADPLSRKQCRTQLKTNSAYKSESASNFLASWLPRRGLRLSIYLLIIRFALTNFPDDISHLGDSNMYLHQDIQLPSKTRSLLLISEVDEKLLCCIMARSRYRCYCVIGKVNWGCDRYLILQISLRTLVTYHKSRTTRTPGTEMQSWNVLQYLTKYAKPGRMQMPTPNAAWNVWPTHTLWSVFTVSDAKKLVFSGRYFLFWRTVVYRNTPSIPKKMRFRYIGFS